MRPAISLLIAVMMLIVAIDGCKKKLPQATNSLPYSTVAEQRAALASKPIVTPIRLLDSVQIISDLQYLASDTCEGRKPGTAGHAKAIERIAARMRSAELDSFDNTLTRTFVASTVNGEPRGINAAGWVKGTIYPDKFIVISSHYDHLGKAANGSYYYGADDNASGVACLLAMAKYFKANPHPYSLIFVAFDREETGLEGAYNFVNYFQTSGKLATIKFNLNMDMIARSDDNEIFACGIKRNPSFKYVIDQVQSKTNVKLLMGHDEGARGNDWTNASDHSAFDQKDIPFIYVGVEDHADYHQITDTYSRINYSRYIENCNMIAQMVQVLKP